VERSSASESSFLYKYSSIAVRTINRLTTKIGDIVGYTPRETIKNSNLDLVSGTIM